MKRKLVCAVCNGEIKEVYKAKDGAWICEACALPNFRVISKIFDSGKCKFSVVRTAEELKPTRDMPGVNCDVYVDIVATQDEVDELIKE